VRDGENSGGEKAGQPEHSRDHEQDDDDQQVQVVTEPFLNNPAQCGGSGKDYILAACSPSGSE